MRHKKSVCTYHRSYILRSIELEYLKKCRIHIFPKQQKQGSVKAVCVARADGGSCDMTALSVGNTFAQTPMHHEWSPFYTTNPSGTPLAGSASWGRHTWGDRPKLHRKTYGAFLPASSPHPRPEKYIYIYIYKIDGKKHSHFRGGARHGLIIAYQQSSRKVFEPLPMA